MEEEKANPEENAQDISVENEEEENQEGNLAVVEGEKVVKEQ